MKKLFVGVILMVLVLSMAGSPMAHPQAGVDYFADRFLVCFRPEAGEIDVKVVDEGVSTGMKSFDQLAREFSVTRIERWLPRARETDGAGGIYLSRIYRAWFARKDVAVEEVIRAFGGDDHLLYAEPEGIMRPCYVPNDPSFDQQWYLTHIQANLAWGLWIDRGEMPGDTSIVIGVVDIGFAWDHPDLIDNLWQNLGEDADGDGHTVEWADTGWVLDPGDLNGVDDDDWDDEPESFVDDLIGWDCAGKTDGHDPDNNPTNPPPVGGPADELLKHGSVVAGIASAATDNGVGIASVGWRLRFMPVKVTYDEDPNFALNHGYDGILYAAQAGADIISCSWGGYGGSSQCATVQTASEIYGVAVFCASGSNNSSALFYPACCPSAISVAATTYDDAKATFSNYGSYIDLCAPGDNILSSVPEEFGLYAPWSGTSAASPMAAGSFGLLKSMFPDSGNAWLERELLESCDDIDSLNPGYEGLLGHGRVNVYRAIASNLFPDLRYVSSVAQEDSGDGDGELEPGETARLVVTLRNEEGWLPAVGVRAWLRTSDGRIEVADSVGSYGDIVGGSVVGNFGDFFRFVLSEDMAGDSSIPMVMEVVANEEGEWPYRTFLSFSIEAPSGLGEVNEAFAPYGYSLAPNVPNPFNAETEIAFMLPRISPVALRVYNLRGELVRVLVSGREDQGHHRVRWDGRNEHGGEVASGVYLCRLSAGAFTATRKLLLLR